MPNPSLPPPAVIQNVERGLLKLDVVVPRLAQPNLPAVRLAVDGLYDGLILLIDQTMPPNYRSGELIYSTLQSSFLSFQALRLRKTWPAAVLLVRTWTEEMAIWRKIHVRTVGGDLEEAMTAFHEGVNRIWETWVAEGVSVEPAEQTDSEWVLLFNQVVGETIAHDLVDGRTRAALRALLTSLDLSQDDVGRMLGVSGETVRRWERGQSRIPTDRKADILAAEGALNRLLEVFQPERLPLVIRREVPLFEGESALDLIHRGRIAEVAERYESAFLYQG